MTIEVDPERVTVVTASLARRAASIGDIAHRLTEIGIRLRLEHELAHIVVLCREVADELDATHTVLEERTSAALAADRRPFPLLWSDVVTGSAWRRLVRSLDDGTGAIGDGDDRRRLVAQTVLGEAVTDLDAALDCDVLAAATPEQFTEYWSLLDGGARDDAIDHSTVEVSDAYQGGHIELDEVQVAGLQLHPIPIDGRYPRSGSGTDWAGLALPDPPTVWTYDQPPRSLFGGSVVCAAIQGVSPLPSAAPSDAGQIAAATPGTVRQLRSLVRDPARAMRVGAARIPTVDAAAAIADLVLCRVGVGSGYPISTATTVDARGQVVYEGSRTDHKYDIDGVPLHPDPRARDRQMWNAEHRNEHGLVTEPYPGFPAYEINASGYPGGE